MTPLSLESLTQAENKEGGVPPKKKGMLVSDEGTWRLKKQKQQIRPRIGVLRVAPGDTRRRSQQGPVVGGGPQPGRTHPLSPGNDLGEVLPGLGGGGRRC